MKKWIFTAVMSTGLIVSAAVKLPAIFSDHAVLLRSKNTAVFGWADPGEKVTVSINGIKSSTVTAKNGKWQVALDLSSAPEGPFVLNINDKKIKDVLIGEVWLCSGQSNMEFRLRSCDNFAAENKQLAGSRLRSFKVVKKLSKTPLQDVKGRWQKAVGKPAGLMTAIGYFFGKKLLNSLNTPVGLIDSSWGGTPIETWMSEADAAASPGTVKYNQSVVKIFEEFPERQKQTVKAWYAWEKKFNRADTAAHTLPPADAKYTTITPASGKAPCGAVWFCTEINVPKKRAGVRLPFMIQRPLPLVMYVNGTRVAEFTLDRFIARENFNGVIPGNLIKAGKNSISLRVFSSRHPASSFLKNRIIFSPFKVGKSWQMYVERAIPQADKAMLKAAPSFPPITYEFRILARAYNAMIKPLAPYSLRGILWYQGEANASRAALYSESFPAMISGWRKLFGAPELPFYYCQLAPYYSKVSNPGTRATWAELREAQEAALKLPRTGQAVLLDVGEAKDIHPRNKKTPADRLAAMALEEVYGKKSNDCVHSPRVKAAVREKNGIRVSFINCGKGLKAAKLPATYDIITARKLTAKLERNSPASEVEGFAVQDAKGKWHWANAAVEGDSVLVTADKVSDIRAVRYGWANNPTCNLVNSNDLPASSFQIKVSK